MLRSGQCLLVVGVGLDVDESRVCPECTKVERERVETGEVTFASENGDRACMG